MAFTLLRRFGGAAGWGVLPVLSAYCSRCHSAAADDGLITAVQAASTPLWDRGLVQRRIEAVAEPGEPLAVTVVLGHWEATEAGTEAALEYVVRHKARLVLSGGDGIGRGDRPLVARAVMRLDPDLHLAFQHVKYLAPDLSYHPNTVFLPHMAFLDGQPVHSGFTGDEQNPVCIGALRDQLELLHRLRERYDVRPNFVFLGGGKTAASEFVALVNSDHPALDACQVVVLRGIPSRGRPDEPSLVEQQALAMQSHPKWLAASERDVLVFDDVLVFNRSVTR